MKHPKRIISSNANTKFKLTNFYEPSGAATARPDNKSVQKMPFKPSYDGQMYSYGAVNMRDKKNKENHEPQKHMKS